MGRILTLLLLVSWSLKLYTGSAEGQPSFLNERYGHYKHFSWEGLVGAHVPSKDGFFGEKQIQEYESYVSAAHGEFTDFVSSIPGFILFGIGSTTSVASHMHSNSISRYDLRATIQNMTNRIINPIFLLGSPDHVTVDSWTDVNFDDLFQVLHNAVWITGIYSNYKVNVSREMREYMTPVSGFFIHPNELISVGHGMDKKQCMSITNRRRAIHVHEAKVGIEEKKIKKCKSNKDDERAWYKLKESYCHVSASLKTNRLSDDGIYIDKDDYDESEQNPKCDRETCTNTGEQDTKDKIDETDTDDQVTKQNKQDKEFEETKKYKVNAKGAHVRDEDDDDDIPTHGYYSTPEYEGIGRYVGSYRIKKNTLVADKNFDISRFAVTKKNNHFTQMKVTYCAAGENVFIIGHPGAIEGDIICADGNYIEQSLAKKYLGIMHLSITKGTIVSNMCNTSNYFTFSGISWSGWSGGMVVKQTNPKHLCGITLGPKLSLSDQLRGICSSHPLFNSTVG